MLAYELRAVSLLVDFGFKLPNGTALMTDMLG